MKKPKCNILLCSVPWIKMLMRHSGPQFWIKVAREKDVSDFEGGFIIATGASVTDCPTSCVLTRMVTEVTFAYIGKTSVNRFGNCSQMHTFNNHKRKTEEQLLFM